jgi:hypothetical protein
MNRRMRTKGVIDSKQEGIIVDDLCPVKNTVSGIELKEKVKKGDRASAKNRQRSKLIG